MGGYLVKDQLLNGGSVACSAATTTTVSNAFRVTEAMSLNFLARVVCSAMAQTTAISFKLQESWGALSGAAQDWEDVGSASSVSAVKKTFNGGVAEITDTTWPTTAGASQADYILITAPQSGNTYAVWLDIDAAGTVPTGALYVASTTKIKVPIVTAGTAAQNAALARTALLASAVFLTEFSVSTITTATFTVTELFGGAVTDITPKNADDSGAGSITKSVSTQGTDGNVTIATDRIAITAHGFSTTDPVIYTAGTQAVGGLVTNTTYYIIKVDADTLKLATTQANALAGTAIDLTTAGTGTSHALYKAAYEIRMNITNTTSEAQMPLLPAARVACVTGASDTCTVSDVLVTLRN